VIGLELVSVVLEALPLDPADATVVLSLLPQPESVKRAKTSPEASKAAARLGNIDPIKRPDRSFRDAT